MAKVKTMAKNKIKRSRGFTTQTLYKFIRLAGVGYPVIRGVVQYGFTKEAAVDALKGYLGVDINSGTFDWADLAAGWTPAVAAVGVTYGIPKLAGLIRSFGRG